MDFANFLIQTLNSVQYGLLLFMLAAGLTLIFGIMGVVNLAHGSFYMLGAYLAFSLSSRLGSFTAAIIVGTLLSVVFGLVLERLLFRYFYHRDHLDQVLLTFGLIYIFEEMRSLFWGDDVHGVAIPPLLKGSIALTENQPYPVSRLFMMGVCVLLAIGLYLLINKTRLGMKIRAGAFNREMTESLGVNIKLIHSVVFALGVAPASVGGVSEGAPAGRPEASDGHAATAGPAAGAQPALVAGLRRRPADGRAALPHPDGDRQLHA